MSPSPGIITVVAEQSGPAGVVLPPITRKLSSEETFKTKNSQKNTRASMDLHSVVRTKQLEFQDKAAAPRIVSIIRDFLERQEGSSLRAWLRHFDTNGDRRISQAEFADGMHRLHFSGDSDDIANAFKILDRDGSGELTLDEIDLGQATLWKKFCAWCAALFEGPEDMILRVRSSSPSANSDSPSSPSPSGISPNPGDRSPRTPAAQGLRPVSQGRSLATQLNLTIDRQTFCDGIVGLGWDEGHGELLFLSIDADDSGSITPDSLQWLTVEKTKKKRKDNAKYRALVQHRRSISKSLNFDGAKLDATLRDFKVFLKRKYGNFVRAWRRALSDSSMVLKKNDLFKAVSKIGWQGDVRLLWTALDKDESGSITMEELDMKGAELLAHFHKFIMERFGSASSAFRDLDRQNKKKLTLEDFESALHYYGFVFPAKPIYQGLDFEGHKFVKEQDFQILQNWKPPAFLVAVPSPAAAEEFKQVLLEKYTCYLKAWRHCLDADCSNRCNWEEFERGAKKAGFEGDVAGAWRALDQDLSGYLSLRELDPDANDILINFRRWADEEFGGVLSAFSVFDADGSNSVTFREFKRACRDFGLQLNIHKLFSALDVEENGTISTDEIKFLDDWELRQRQQSFEDINESSLHNLRCRSYIAQELTEYETDGPGPGAYNILTTMGAGPTRPMVKFSGAYTMAKQQGRIAYVGKGVALEPSPWDYNAQGGASSAALHKPLYSFTKEARPTVDAQGPPSTTPGPGNYTIPNDGPHIPHITCGPRRILRQHPLFRGDPCPRAPPRVTYLTRR